MKNVLVTGATGFIGFELAHQLVARGFRPRLLVRRPTRAPLFASLDAELMQGDLRSEVSLRRAVQGVDTVFHLGARATFESYAQLVEPNVRGSERLMKAALEAGAQRFVFASSLLVHGSQKDPITSATPPNPALGYGRAKLEAERSLQAMTDGTSMALSAVRLPHVYGSQSLLFQQVRRGLLVFPGAMTNRYGHLHVADAARALIAVAESGWTGVSAIADYAPVDWIEFFSVLHAHYPRFRLLRIPEWLARLGAVALSPFVRLTGRPSMYTQGTVRGFNFNLPVQPGLLWGELGIEPLYRTFHEGIPASTDGALHFQWKNPVFDREGANRDDDFPASLHKSGGTSHSRASSL